MQRTRCQSSDDRRSGRLRALGNRSRRSRRGAVLLDVIIALGLFVMAASVVVGGVGASVNATYRMKQEVTAENLAVSVLSELSAGIRPVDSEGPEPFEPPFEDFTWEVSIEPMPSGQETGGLRNVEVHITHASDDVNYRLNQFLAIDPGASGEGSLLERLEELDAGFD